MRRATARGSWRRLFDTKEQGCCSHEATGEHARPPLCIIICPHLGVPTPSPEPAPPPVFAVRAADLALCPVCDARLAGRSRLKAHLASRCDVARNSPTTQTSLALRGLLSPDAHGTPSLCLFRGQAVSSLCAGTCLFMGPFGLTHLLLGRACVFFWGECPLLRQSHGGIDGNRRWRQRAITTTSPRQQRHPGTGPNLRKCEHCTRAAMHSWHDVLNTRKVWKGLKIKSVP